jgi:hypothetical protein
MCNVIAHWSESLRTRNHTLLSHLRLPQPGGPGSRVYIPKGQGVPVIPLGTGSLSVAFYDSQFCCGDILTSLHTGYEPSRSRNYAALCK